MEQDEHMTKQERRELRQQEKREEELQRHHSRLIKKWTKILFQMLSFILKYGKAATMESLI